MLTSSNYTYYKSSFAIKDVLYEAEEDIVITMTNPNGCITTKADPPAEMCDDTDHHFYAPNNSDNDISLLRYRAYHPVSTDQNATDGYNYKAVPLPCVVLFHPGGFKECPDYLTPGLVTICKQLAARGYIAITVGYRGGRILDQTTSPSNASITSVQQQLAPYRAIQDGRGAIRSIMKRNNSNTPDNHLQQFIIDEDQFFVGGLSAGAITAVSIAYYRSQTMINQVFPVASNSTLNVQQALGHINADYYYGEPGTDLNNPDNWPVIRGVLNCWGGITIPKIFDGINPDYGTSESGFFAGSGGQINPPIIGFAGAQDKTVYFADDDTKQNILNSTNLLYRKEDFCFNNSGYYLLKDTGSNNDKIYIKQCSAQNLYYILKHSSIDRFTELYIDCNMMHGINNYVTDNFGVNATNPNDVYTYIAIRAAIFFQTIMNVAPTAAFPKFAYRGKSLFRSINDTDHLTNQRICTQCDNDPVGDTCNNLPDDPECN